MPCSMTAITSRTNGYVIRRQNDECIHLAAASETRQKNRRPPTVLQFNHPSTTALSLAIVATAIRRMLAFRDPYRLCQRHRLHRDGDFIEGVCTVRLVLIPESDADR